MIVRSRMGGESKLSSRSTFAIECIVRKATGNRFMSAQWSHFRPPQEGRAQLGRSQNQLLSTLPDAALALLLPHFRESALQLGAVLRSEGAAAEHVYFPLSGIVTLHIDIADGRSVETNMVGYDSGVDLIAGLGIDYVAGRAVVQVPGRTIRISKPQLALAASQSPAVHDMILRSSTALLWDAQQNVACRAVHDVQSRLCRWLLHSHHLCRGETLPLTQEFLARMLAVRRTTVTAVARVLQAEGIIRYRRGTIHIADPAALQERACECYQITRARNIRLLREGR